MVDAHRRQELDPATTTDLRDVSAAPPEKAQQLRVDSPDVTETINELIGKVGGDPTTFDGRLIRELLSAGLKLIPDQRETGELKLMTAALKELRYAYRVFAQYPGRAKVTIFGSARTPEDHPDYRCAVEFSELIHDTGWMTITGAGDGIMKAGHEGPGADGSFGVAIRLPFETTANDVIAGDPKLIHFRYFFTRKLMFLSQCDAVALFPGGFGTLDEVYETLTLIQTGKASMVPIVMLAGEGNEYWTRWHKYTSEILLEQGLISPEDLNLYKIVDTPQQAVEYINNFYRVYHSSRYVRNDLVIRLKHTISQKDVERLNEEFAGLIESGEMHLRGAFEAEDDHLDLPRLVFTHTRHQYGLVRKLIDRINECDPA